MILNLLGIEMAAAPFLFLVRKLFALVLLAATAAANETTYRSMQSGSPTGPTPLHAHGIHGEGQIIAVLDTGADYNSCYFAEGDNSAPPFNTGTPLNGLDWENVSPSRRKIIAYDFLYSCDQYPSAPGCDVPGAAGSLDNQGHGTHAAATAAGDRGAPIAHDYADAIAPGAKLVIQDAGYIGGDLCSQRPGIGCPVKLTPILEQAYRQGARIHSNSWGDRQGSASVNPPTANYPQSARDVDAFVWSHPDMLVVFNTGNLATVMPTPLSSLSAPGSAKNTLQVGGTRYAQNEDDTIAPFTLFGPTRDGRIKPDLVAPARVVAGDVDFDSNPATCDSTYQPGTSWSSPSVAGAAALVRQYYVDGFYPTGAAIAANAIRTERGAAEGDAHRRGASAAVAQGHRREPERGRVAGSIIRTGVGISRARRRALFSGRCATVVRRRRLAGVRRVEDVALQRSRRSSLQSRLGLDRSSRHRAFRQ